LLCYLLQNISATWINMSDSAKAVFLSYASPAFAKVYPPSAAPKATRATAGRQDAMHSGDDVL